MVTVELALIPEPQQIVRNDGGFVINAYTRIKAPAVEGGAVRLLAAIMHQASGFDLTVEYNSDDPEPGENSIHLLTENGDSGDRPEGYKLDVTPEYIQIRASQRAGLFYGVQTLRQLLPLAADAGGAANGKPCLIPAVAIKDWPRFLWRGLHLDVSRHMFPVSFIKKYLDLMALHKLNVFHWHLTDDQGWRVEIKKRPLLTAIGSWRASTPVPGDRSRQDGRSYGGFYSQEEVKEIVAYAAERFITVVPEIEMPGHAMAALSAYPELGCSGKGYHVATRWGIAEELFCAGNEDTFHFLEEVLSEVMALFPGEMIHVGGDECPKTRWQSCPKCQAAMAREGLADEAELQSYFIARIERYLNDSGRRLVGWDEIIEGGLAPNATVMSWRGMDGGIEAAKAGHDVVMCPTTHCYFDYYQSEDQENEPPALGGFIPLEKVYDFDPYHGIPEEHREHVLGGQGNLWTEFINHADQAEYMVYPRAAALAEVIWTGTKGRDFPYFCQRLRKHLFRLDQMEVNYRRME